MEIGPIRKAAPDPAPQADSSRAGDDARKITLAREDEYLSTHEQIGDLADSARRTYDISDVRHQRVIEVQKTIEGSGKAVSIQGKSSSTTLGPQAVTAYFSDDTVLEKIAARLADDVVG